MLLAFLAFTRAFVKAAPGRGEDGSLHSLVFVLVVYFDWRQQWQRERERDRERDTPGEKVYYRPGEVACFSIPPLLSLSLSFYLYMVVCER